ncbi:HCLS1-associated protein X-1 [Heterodontus francisci]|uniref:HCLS1-associated protein X-1 n=1 Tax=Heterodontus francisci TaxID=7792 RepID=UPI00355B1AE7
MSLFGLFRGFFGFPERGGGRDAGKLYEELPGIAPYPYARGQEEEGSNSRRAPRDWMLKQPDRDQPGSFERGTGEDRGPESGTRPWDRPARDEPSGGPLTPYRRPWNPSSTFEDFWKSLRQGDAVKEDKDLDSRVNSEGLDDILKPSEPKTHSSFKTVSISKVLLPMGCTVEERRVTRDSEGNEETRITRAQGEQSYTTVTRRDPQGKEERTEQMVNMDDRDLQRFAERWERQEGSDALGERQGFRDSLSFLNRLLKGIFSGR